METEDPEDGRSGAKLHLLGSLGRKQWVHWRQSEAETSAKVCSAQVLQLTTDRLESENDYFLLLLPSDPGMRSTDVLGLSSAVRSWNS